jgi:predicted TIM-barrel fold metal-dependent hydrolase
MERAIVVSSDGHASMPPTLWEDYLERKYHPYLPQLRQENDLYNRVMWVLNGAMLSPEALEVCDTEGVWRAKHWEGLWDLDTRLAEMDREGTAAEFVFFGDFRTADLFHNVTNGTYPAEVIDAGTRAYDRWAVDTFGAADGRLLLTGAMGSCLDRDSLLKELEWVADHGFAGTFAPGFVGVSGLPPLYDEYWDPVWSFYATRGMAVIVHGGYGMEPGVAIEAMEAADTNVRQRGGSDMDLIIELTSGMFNAEFFTDMRCRRAMWQLMLGGVFDRHPDLKLMMTEVRADWIPAILRHLDGLWALNRRGVAAQRPPSEYWQTNCMAGLSFMHRAEVEMRDEIGVENIAFGRDYPHAESTWPNTAEYFKLLFHGVPQEDTRMMLGENAIRFLALDGNELGKIAEKIGPDVEAITAPGAADEVDPALTEHLALRCGVLKPAEGDERLAAADEMLREDLARL